MRVRKWHQASHMQHKKRRLELVPLEATPQSGNRGILPDNRTFSDRRLLRNKYKSLLFEAVIKLLERRGDPEIASTSFLSHGH